MIVLDQIISRSPIPELWFLESNLNRDCSIQWQKNFALISDLCPQGVPPSKGCKKFFFCNWCKSNELQSQYPLEIMASLFEKEGFKETDLLSLSRVSYPLLNRLSIGSVQFNPFELNINLIQELRSKRIKLNLLIRKGVDYSPWFDSAGSIVGSITFESIKMDKSSSKYIKKCDNITQLSFDQCEFLDDFFQSPSSLPLMKLKICNCSLDIVQMLRWIDNNLPVEVDLGLGSLSVVQALTLAGSLKSSPVQSLSLSAQIQGSAWKNIF